MKRYTDIVFDIDGTLLDTERTGVLSLIQTVKELTGKEMSYEEAYGYFGTPYYERHYSDLLQYVAKDCDLRYRADLALMDRGWVNTWNTEPTKIVVNGAYSNGDGTYDILITVDVIERSAYWTYEGKEIPVRITVVEAPERPLGFLALATY